ncbi:unnamed protein product [Caenorhabditis brenneri]
MKVLFLLCLVAAGALAQFSSTGQQGIVDAHNKLRSSIAKGTYVAKGTTQKSGANLRKIKWDATVALALRTTLIPAQLDTLKIRIWRELVLRLDSGTPSA